MAFKVGDAVRLKAGGAQMTVSKLFKSPEGREMVQCTWFDNKSRVHRAEFVMDSLEVADAIGAAPYVWGARLRLCREFGVPRRLMSVPAFNATPVTPDSLTE
jgi:uncharacterized protein YodC (DUF2158 family)